MYPKISTTKTDNSHFTPPSLDEVSRQSLPVVVRRGSDILATVPVNLNLNESAESIARAASDANHGLPSYPPDGAGVIIIFHTDSGTQVLGGVRENPALQGVQTRDGCTFPLQMTTTLGARVTEPERPLKDLLIDAARGRILPKTPIATTHESDVDLKVLLALCDALAAPVGWEARICVHTDKWSTPEGRESTMCYLTAVKHLQCSDDRLAELSKALASSMTVKRAQGEDTRSLMSFRFARLETLVGNACATYSLDEKAKAEQAWQQFGSEVAVTFNDLAVATLASNGGLCSAHPAALI